MSVPPMGPPRVTADNIANASCPVHGALFSYDPSCGHVPYAYGVIRGVDGRQHFFARAHLSRGIIADDLDIGEELEFHVHEAANFFSGECQGVVTWAYAIRRPSPPDTSALGTDAVSQSSCSQLSGQSACNNHDAEAGPASFESSSWCGESSTRLTRKRPRWASLALKSPVVSCSMNRGSSSSSTAGPAPASEVNSSKGYSVAVPAGVKEESAAMVSANELGREATGAVHTLGSARVYDGTNGKSRIRHGPGSRFRDGALMSLPDDIPLRALVQDTSIQASKIAKKANGQETAMRVAAARKMSSQPSMPARSDFHRPHASSAAGFCCSEQPVETKGSAAETAPDPFSKANGTSPSCDADTAAPPTKLTLQHFVRTLLKEECDAQGWSTSLRRYYATPVGALFDWELDEINRTIAAEAQSLGVKGRLPIVRKTGVVLSNH